MTWHKVRLEDLATGGTTFTLTSRIISGSRMIITSKVALFAEDEVPSGQTERGIATCFADSS